MPNHSDDINIIREEFAPYDGYQSYCFDDLPDVMPDWAEEQYQHECQRFLDEPNLMAVS